MSDSPLQIAVPDIATTASRRRFYSRRDMTAFAITALVAFAGYLYTLAPSVTLEDSGEFLTAANHLGVPHPPGYPIWTICAWIWQHIIPFGNIAWRINLMSAFFSALAAGLITLLTSKSGHVMAVKVGFLQKLANRQLEDFIILVSSVAAGLLIALSPVMWSQAVIAEVYGLNAFCLAGTLVVLYRWSFEPERRWRLYLAAFVWGVGLTAHQTLVLLTVAFPTFVWLADKKFGRDVLVPILVVIIGGVVYTIIKRDSMFHEGPFAATVLLALGIGSAVWLYFLWQEGPGLMRMWPQALLLYFAVVLGMGLYLYEPLSSSTNPPMNWGYTRTFEGFVHHFTRGQYEKVHTERTLLQLWGQLNMFFDDLQGQFNIVYALLALLALFFYRDLADHDRDWMKFLLVGFLFLSVGFIFLSNPTFEKQKQFTDRVFFLPAHCIYSIWIGYGLILGLGFLFTEKPRVQAASMPILAVVVLLPLWSVKRNWADEEERGHDFGYRFGYLMFKPGGGYPEMDKDAVLYGGTDPGRFVPTYMIFVESQVARRAKSHFGELPESGTFDRRDVYIITQNALADSTYMSYIRDHYDYSRPDPNNPHSLDNRSPWQRALFMTAWPLLGRDRAYPKEPIWIPSEKDAQSAFQRYIDELRSRPPMPGEDVKIEGGRVSVQGVAGVMAINGYLTKDIFDHNKDKHAFYVEESYVISWMYPYMEPYGIILKINREPIQQITPEIVARDKAYWDALSANLIHDPKFKRDDVAQKTFSKLRSAIGGIYSYRKMAADAEYAFKQAIDLCPDSPEANFRLAQLYLEQGRFDDATTVLQNYQKRDPHNPKIGDAVKSVQDMKQRVEDVHQLEQQYAAQPNNVQIALQLIERYAQVQRVDAMDAIAQSLLARSDLSAADVMALAQPYAKLQRADRVTQILGVFVQRFPQNPVGWYNLGVIYAARNDCQQALTALESALAVDSPDGQVRKAAAQDRRLDNCRKDPRFQKLMEQPRVQGVEGTSGLPFTIAH
jgi:tetratricopeptide (TPR) repeat protein